MICIGTNGADRFIFKLAEKYSDAGLKTEICMESCSPGILVNSKEKAEKNGCDIFIVGGGLGIMKYDIFIFYFADSPKSISLLKSIRPGGYVIINADSCSTFPYILPADINVVTCGVNSNASVTFSGINDYRNGRETLQCCVQKYIRTIYGKWIEPQEFGVNIVGNYPLSEVLVIITAAIMGGIEETVTKECLFSTD
ncbi:hypothetical protein IMSAG049_00497 [Clostridiales bacterium]|nr:hypothetical protein IMSAG049_00497 [Clostridiales bacterium]